MGNGKRYIPELDSFLEFDLIDCLRYDVEGFLFVVVVFIFLFFIFLFFVIIFFLLLFFFFFVFSS